MTGEKEWKIKPLMLPYGLGLVLGTILLNTQFDIVELASCKPVSWSAVHYGMLVLKRAAGFVLCYWFVYILPEKVRMPALACLGGGIIGVIVSIHAYAGYFLNCLIYSMFVCVLVMIYMGEIYWILSDSSEKCGIGEISRRKYLMKRGLIVTIILINCVLELKFLKFF